MLRALALLTLTAALSACGLSPQVIEIHPSAQVEATNTGHNAPVAVFAVDSRSQTAFGTRGGVYKDTALVQPANDVKSAIEDAVKKGLQTQGFNAFNPGDDATSLEVRLEQLDYIPEAGAVVNEVNLHLVLSAQAKRGDVTHSGTYKSDTVHQFPVTPSAARNQAIINGILSSAIERLLRDPKMLAFLAGNDAP